MKQDPLVQILQKEARKFTCGVENDRDGNLTYSIESKDLDTLIEIAVLEARREMVRKIVSKSKSKKDCIKALGERNVKKILETAPPHTTKEEGNQKSL